MWLEATKQNAGIFTMVRSNLRKFRNFLPWLEATT
jgi:hypothetical protein